MNIKSRNWTKIMTWVGVVLGGAATAGWVTWGPITELRDKYRDRGVNITAVMQQQTTAKNERRDLERILLNIEPRLRAVELNYQQVAQQLEQTRDAIAEDRATLATREQVQKSQDETRASIDAVKDDLNSIETDVAINALTTQHIDKKVDMILEALVGGAEADNPNVER